MKTIICLLWWKMWWKKKKKKKSSISKDQGKTIICIFPSCLHRSTHPKFQEPNRSWRLKILNYSIPNILSKSKQARQRTEIRHISPVRCNEGSSTVHIEESKNVKLKNFFRYDSFSDFHCFPRNQHPKNERPSTNQSLLNSFVSRTQSSKRFSDFSLQELDREAF